MTDNPTGAENAQVQDDALTKARTILFEYERDTKGEIALVWRIEAALRETEREAEQRGMMRAAEIARSYSGCAPSPVIIAKAIERAATPPATESK